MFAINRLKKYCYGGEKKIYFFLCSCFCIKAAASVSSRQQSAPLIGHISSLWPKIGSYVSQLAWRSHEARRQAEAAQRRACWLWFSRGAALHFSIMHHCHRSYTTAKTNPSPKARWTREMTTMPNTLHMLARSIYSETIKTKSLFSLNVLSSLTDSENKFMNRSSKESSDNR